MTILFFNTLNHFVARLMVDAIKLDVLARKSHNATPPAAARRRTCGFSKAWHFQGTVAERPSALGPRAVALGPWEACVDAFVRAHD